jgi:hypothetical protein
VDTSFPQWAQTQFKLPYRRYSSFSLVTTGAHLYCNVGFSIGYNLRSTVTRRINPYIYLSTTRKNTTKYVQSPHFRRLSLVASEYKNAISSQVARHIVSVPSTSPTIAARMPFLPQVGHFLSRHHPVSIQILHSVSPGKVPPHQAR